MDTVRRKKYDTEWMEMVRNHAASGQSIKQWCAENGIAEKTFYVRRNSLISRGLLDASGDPAKAVDPSQIPSANDTHDTGFVEVTASQRNPQPSTALVPFIAAPAAGSGLVIYYRDFQIAVSSLFDGQALSRVLEVMRLVE